MNQFKTKKYLNKLHLLNEYRRAGMKNFVRFVSLFVVCLFLLPCFSTKAELAISQQILNFGRCTKDSIPILKFAIQNFINEPVQVKLIPSQDWIHLSVTSFEASSQEIEVRIDPTTLTFKPDVYLESIKIESGVGNYSLPVRLDLVEKKVKIQFVIDNRIATVDGEETIMKGAPFIRGGKTFVPLRIIVEAFGGSAEPEINHSKNYFYVHTFYKDIKIRFQIGVPVVLYNDKEQISIDAAPYIWADRTNVTINTIKQLFNANVSYEAKIRTITIEY
jgi:hypothetical protein